MLRNTMTTAPTRAPTMARKIAVTLLLAGTLAACSPPSPPDEERRPEPRANASTQSGIVHAADAYKERARSAGAQQREAADAQRAEIDAATQ